ncbi:MAG: FKBP-type peptidyl-prolyl cis-trans isomerase [Bacteroidota bacterium]|nr:FKBP-type peptidyl-prolyl cis-trans isomerase [Bacteroidota bacterium]
MQKQPKVFLGTIALIVIIMTGLYSCKKNKSKTQKEEDEKIIKQYIADHNLSATATGTGLYYVMTSQGTGTQPTISSTVTVAYRGYLTNGNSFDQSGASGATFPLQSVIKGWQEGIPLYKKGGKGVLLIPSELGYGSKTQNKIPANSVLIFDVELLNVQ